MVPLTSRGSTRTYAHAKSFLLVTYITLDVVLLPSPQAHDAIGEVANLHHTGFRQVEMGQAQA